MKFVFFYHSLVSDWNHGNAHFLRGVLTELLALGHEARVFEPLQGWSLQNLRQQSGQQAIDAFHTAYPGLRSSFYDPATLDLDAALDGADVVIAHEWNDANFVARLGRHRARTRCYKLLFHDTHHRTVSAPQEMGACDLSHYDGVLAFGEVLRSHYQRHGWARQAWTWHEAADTRVFHPLSGVSKTLDLVWVGNWGDDERSREIAEFLIEPARTLGLRARVHGVRYPPHALTALQHAGIEYAGWIANFDVPAAFARAHATLHIPRRFYREQLPGIPTIRVFEALACRMPLVSAPWEDTEGLFEPGRDFLAVRDGREMRRCLDRLRCDDAFAQEIAERGYRTLLSRHTCAHRVQELLGICREVGAGVLEPKPVALAG